MFNFLLPAKTKQVLAEAELILSNLTRNRIYAQDILVERDLTALTALEDRYPALIKAKDVEGLQKLNKESMKLGNKLFPPSPWDGWRENVEVFVVAAIMALAIRTFFLQPFKIPTGSMEPTLLGIEPRPSTEVPPSLPYQAYDFLIHGRTYSRVVTRHGGRIIDMTSGTMTIWFEYTDVHLEDAQGNQETDRIWIRKATPRARPTRPATSSPTTSRRPATRCWWTKSPTISIPRAAAMSSSSRPPASPAWPMSRAPTRKAARTSSSAASASPAT